MIVVDTSALVALDRVEPTAFAVGRALRSDSCVISAPTALELTLVLSRFYGTEGRAAAENLVDRFSITVLPFGPEDLLYAQTAFLRYGKGHHPARLNFGDCISYALAKRLGAPLLYVGEDFGLTDVQTALS